MNSKFLKLALLTGDDFGILLAAEELRSRKILSGTKFNFNEYEAPRCKHDFRFEKEDILKLKKCLRIPDKMKTPQGLKFSGIEGNKCNTRNPDGSESHTNVFSSFRSLHTSETPRLPEQVG